MIDSVQITQVEKDLLLQHYRKPSFRLISERAHTILLNATGKTPYEISQILFRDEKTIRGWVKSFNQRRISSLFPRYEGNQNASKLTQAQKEGLKKILASPPSKSNDEGLIPKAFWDVSSLRNYLLAKLGVTYESPRSYHLLFKICNFSFKLPAKFDLSRKDEGDIQERISEIRQEITPFLKDPGWAVLVGDESRIVWEAIVRRCWLPKGQKSVLKVERENVAQNYAGFLDLKKGKPYLFPVPWQNQKETIKVLKRLTRKYPHQKICLVWDNASWHKGKMLREKLKTELRNFYLLAFPPYAPDTNPQEHVWKWAKDQISNVQFGTMQELTKTFKKIITGRNYPYQI